MHADKRLDDTLSGTTAISILFRGRTMYVSNVGDSRAIVVSSSTNSGASSSGSSSGIGTNLSQDGRRLVAKPLSVDQTPYRKDERERLKKYGARILSMDQIEGLEPVHENWGDLNLGHTAPTCAPLKNNYLTHNNMYHCPWLHLFVMILSERVLIKVLGCLNDVNDSQGRTSTRAGILLGCGPRTGTTPARPSLAPWATALRRTAEWWPSRRSSRGSSDPNLFPSYRQPGPP